MPSKFVYWTSDGGGVEGSDRARNLHRWILAQNNADLIVYGGDVYSSGRPSDFDLFLQQIGSVSGMCETPGNHDWRTRTNDSSSALPTGYEAFWSRFPPPQSLQPIDPQKTAGARYEHFLDLNGWRLVFLDTGALEYLDSWPMGDQTRVQWLRDALTRTPATRANIVLAHHSRLSWGKHGDNPGVARVWETLFDEAGRPRAVCTIGGHDHNASVYGFHGRDLQPTDAAGGIQLWVNGTGGSGSYQRVKGTRPAVYPRSGQPADDPVMYGVTRVELIDPTQARVSLLSLGRQPRADGQAVVVSEQLYVV